MIWTYKGQIVTSLEDVPEGAIGFIYKIYNIRTGKMYIGSKMLHTSRKTKISNREKVKTGTRKRFKQVVKESNWFTYTGSCKQLNEDIEKLGDTNFRKVILEFCSSKKYLNFCELEHQVKNDVLREDTYNANILGKFYRRDMEN